MRRARIVLIAEKDVAAIVTMADLQMLQNLEDRMDSPAARRPVGAGRVEFLGAGEEGFGSGVNDLGHRWLGPSPSFGRHFPP